MRRRRRGQGGLGWLLWAIVAAMLLLLAAARHGGPASDWLWLPLTLLPVCFWAVVMVIGVRRLRAWRRARLDRPTTAVLVERGCAAVWGELRFAPLLTVLAEGQALIVAIPPPIIAEAESLRITYGEMRRLEVRRAGLAIACRITFFSVGGRLDEIVLYPRRPARLVAALRAGGVAVTATAPPPARAWVYPLLEVGWACFWLLLLLG